VCGVWLFHGSISLHYLIEAFSLSHKPLKPKPHMIKSIVRQARESCFCFRV